MPQVALKRTPSNASVVLGAMSYAYQKVTGVLPPSFNAILLPTAQSALETSSWKAMWNWNAGNITTNGVTDNWVSLAQLSAATSGLEFKAYKNLGDGCIDMLTWLNKRRILALATNGDVGAYTNALASSCYAGCPGQAGSVDYNAYASIITERANAFRNVTPTPYSTGLGILPSLAIGVGAVAAAGLVAYYLLPETAVHALLGASEDENPSEAGEEGAEVLERENPTEFDEPEQGADEDNAEDGKEEGAEERAPREVQTILFNRHAGWTEAKARTWIRKHREYHFGKVEITKDNIRARQAPPSAFRKGTFRTIAFGQGGIKAVVAQRA